MEVDKGRGKPAGKAQEKVIVANFHLRQPFSKAVALAEAVKQGAARHGDVVNIIHGFDGVRPGALILFGIGGMAREIHDAYKSAGRDILLLDKGYTRNPHIRASVNGFQPLHYMNQHRRDNRWRDLKIECQPYRKSRDGIALLDGGSNKYALWQDLGDWTDWGRKTVEQIQRIMGLEVVYRPRPSHNPPPADMGCEVSIGPLADDLARAAVVVTHGGNIGLDAVIAGVPVVSMGPCVVRRISATTFCDGFGAPTDAARMQMLSDLAYCQWTLGEYSSGQAWSDLRRQFRG